LREDEDTVDEAKSNVKAQNSKKRIVEEWNIGMMGIFR
jgi:hypothetical protein